MKSLNPNPLQQVLGWNLHFAKNQRNLSEFLAHLLPIDYSNPQEEREMFQRENFNGFMAKQ